MSAREPRDRVNVEDVVIVAIPDVHDSNVPPLFTRTHSLCICHWAQSHLVFPLANMASTPLKSHWDSNIAEHGFGSPFSDTGTSQSQTSTNTVQYINSQLVAHGYAQSPGISTEGLSRADEEKLVKCLLSMLSQRMVRRLNALLIPWAYLG